MRLNLKDKHGKQAASNNAFTLVELVVGAGMAAMVYAAVFCGVSTTFRILNSSREELRATQIMVSRLEGVRLEAWGTNQLFNTSYVPTNFTDYFYPMGLSGTTNDGTIYSGTVAITPDPPMTNTPSYSNNIALITVTITWTNGVVGVTNVHTRSMSTYVSQYGLQNYVWTSH